MAEANIVVGLDLKQAIAEARQAGPKIAQALNLNNEIERGLVRPSGNARMALTSLAQTIQDASVVNLDFGSVMRATANNIDFGAAALANLSAEAKKNGSTMGRELLNAIKGPSGILIGVSLLISALTMLPRLIGEADVAMERAAEGGMKKYAERLAELEPSEIVQISKRAEETKKRLLEQQKQLFTLVIPQSGGMPTRVFHSKEAKAQFEELQKQIDIIDGFMEKNKESIDRANELNAIFGLAGGVLGARPFDKQKREAEIAAMKEGIDKEKAIADQKLKDDIDRAKREIENEKVRNEVIQNLRQAHAQKIREIEKPLRDAEVLMSGMSLSEQFKRLGMSGEDLQRVMKFDRSGFENQLLELEKMKELVAKSDLSADKKFSVTKDIENEIERVKLKRLEAEAEIRELKIQAIDDEEQREIASIEERYRQKIDRANLEIADDKLRADAISAYEVAKQAELERVRQQFAEKRKRDDERIERYLAEVSIYRTEGELQVRLNAIHREYEERKAKVEELAKLNRISASEEVELLRNLTNAEHRDRLRAQKQYHEQVRAEWKETHQTALVIINSLNAGIREMMTQFVFRQRQAKDEWDAVWLAIRNTAINALSEIVAKYVENQLISASLRASTTAGEVAQLTAITTAATPAALATNIATMGAAGLAAAGTFQAASASLGAAMSSLKILTAAEGARINRPTLTMIGEVGEPELIAPEKDFYTIAREELIPNVISLIAREGIPLNNYQLRSDSGVSRLSFKGVEKLLKDVKDSIENLSLSVDFDVYRLRWILLHQEKLEKLIGFGG